MARLSLKCSCSWIFFVPETTPGNEVTCPSCGEPVPLPGRGPGRKAISPGELAGRAARLLRSLILLVAGVAGVGLIVFWIQASRREPAPESPVARPRRPDPAIDFPRRIPRSDPSSEPTATPTEPPRKPPRPPDRSEEIALLKREIDRAVCLSNVAGLVSEVLRLRGCSAAREELQCRFSEMEARIRGLLGQIGEAGGRLTIEPHMTAGDVIAAFAQRELAALKPPEAAALLIAWLSRLEGGMLEPCVVLRGPQERFGLWIYVGETTGELLDLARLASSAEPDSPPPQETLSVRMDLPAPLLAQIQSQLGALPAGYRQILPSEDRSRLEVLLQSRRGYPADLEFLKATVVAGHLPRFAKEVAHFKARIEELQEKVKEPTNVDVLYHKEGRKIEGKVLQQTAEFVEMQGRLGRVRVPASDIARVELGKGAGAQFPKDHQSALKKPETLFALVTWCKENNLREEADLCALEILVIDPLNDKARIHLGIPRPRGTTKDPAGAPPK